MNARERHLLLIDEYQARLKDCKFGTPHYHDTKRHLDMLYKQLKLYDLYMSKTIDKKGH